MTAEYEVSQTESDTFNSAFTKRMESGVLHLDGKADRQEWGTVWKIKPGAGTLRVQLLARHYREYTVTGWNEDGKKFQEFLPASHRASFAAGMLFRRIFL